VSQMTDSEKLELLVAAIDAFAKATSMPGGPSLAMQRHEPTWDAWKKICDEINKGNRTLLLTDYREEKLT